MGLDTTGIAALQLGRRFTGIELDETKFQIAGDRLAGIGFHQA
jgi:DNA modification methylase